MTAALGNTAQGTPFATGVDAYVYPQFLGTPLRPPTTQDIYTAGTRWQDNSVNPPIIYETTGGGIWSTEGANHATTTTFGTVILTDNSEPVATKVYADNLVTAGAPVATTTTSGIGKLVSDANAVARIASTGLQAYFVQPSNLTAVMSAPGPIGDVTADTGAFTDLSATGTVSISSAAAITIEVTGAGADLTLKSDAGRVIINGEEAVANAITLLSAAGGIDVDAALQINIASSQNAADAIRIISSAGGIDVDAVGASGEDINILNTGGSVIISATESAADSIQIISTAGGIDILATGASAGEDIDIVASGSSINITSTENDAGAVIIRTNGGTSERITLLSSQGTGVDSINLVSTAGGITLSAALASADAINLNASAGGVDIDGALQVNIASSQNAVDAIRIISSAGGIDIDAIGAATEDINITNTGGSVVIVATESVADAIRMNASGAAGGFDIDAGTNGFIVDTTGAVSLDSAAASNFTVTGAFALDLGSSLGKVTLSSGQSAADSVVITSLIGGIDILAAGASAGEDIDIVATGSSVNIQATESDINAITINASGVAGGINIDSGTNGIIADTTGAISLDSAAASNFTVTGAFALDVGSTLGKVTLSSGQNAADSIVITSSIGGIDILAAGAGAGEDIDIIATGSSVNIRSTESAVDAVVIESTIGGIQILASGAAAGEDILMTATGSSITITATENVTDALNLTASGGASRITLSAGTGSISLQSGLVVKEKAIVFADSPYTVLGTDYFLSVDTSGGAITVTLPNAATLAGRTYVIRDTGGAAAASNITIGTGGGNLVGGGAAAATKTISANYAGATVYSNGVTWNYCYVA